MAEVSREHRRRTVLESVLTLVAVAVMIASSIAVLRSAGEAAERREQREALIDELEDLRSRLSAASDDDPALRRREHAQVRERVARLQPRWRACPPVPGSVPMIVERHGIEMLVLELDAPESRRTEAAPR